MSNRSNGYFGGRGGRGQRSWPSADYRGASGAPPEQLTNPGFYFTHVPAEIISRLKSSYSLLKKSENVRQMLVSYLESSENPYAFALQVVTECEDLFHNKANTLAAFVIEEFCTWARTREQQIKHNLTPQLKYDAFCLITMQRNGTLIKHVIDTFKMQDDNVLFLEKIKDFIATKKYKEACQCAVALGLMSHFSVDHIILPLVLQDKLSIAEEGLATDRRLQIELVTRLDQLVGERSLRNTVDHLIHQLEVPDVKLDRFASHKPLGKLISKLVKTFNLPTDTTPNLNQKRSAGALNFIFHKRFFEKSLSIDSWKEMAADAVKGNYTLQQDLVSMLAGFNEVEEALYWAVEFGIPQHKWPYNVSLLFRDDPLAKVEFPRPPAASGTDEKEDWGDQSDFHTLALPDSSIVMVDSEQLLKDCFDYISNHDCKMVGMDSEWKPAFGGQQNEVALIQLATWDRIFILDVIGMANVSPSVWHDALKLFFENPDIIKLGFSLGSDMVMIKSSIAPLANIKLNGTGYLDLASVWRHLQNKGINFPYSGENSNTGGESLSKLVSVTLGRALNKSDQFSNWELRPLRVGQMRYAALDAFVLLELYRDLQKLADQQGLPFLEICDEIIMGFRNKTAPPPGGYRRGRGRGRRPPRGHSNPGQGSSRGQEEGQEVLKDLCQEQDVRFMADSMLCALGRELRKCGVDCAILDRAVRNQPRCEEETMFKDIIEQDRIVLSKNSNIQWFEARLSPDYVYHVQSTAVTDQLKEILHNFNIIVKEKDVKSRCMFCNSNTFDKVSQELMLELAGVPSESADNCISTEDSVDLDVAASQPTISENIRKWVLSENCSSISQGKTLLGAEIQIKKVPFGVLKNVHVFYICSLCGKVYWDGSHLGRYLKRCRENGTIQSSGQFSDAENA